jgi:hypothetical protein
MVKFQKYFILSLVLASVICGLEAFDAPAYTRCKHIGVCEFLDVLGIKGDSDESQITARDGECNLFLTHIHIHIHIHIHLSSLGEVPLSDLSTCISARKKRRYLDFIDYFSITCQEQGLLNILENHGIKTAILSSRYPFASKDDKPPSQPLQIVAISVIQS